MAQPYGVKTITLDFSRMSGGINQTDPPTDIGKYQVQDALNAVFSNNGFSRSFGLWGLKNSATFSTTRGYGIHVYEKSDGTEILLAASGQKLYTINESTGAPTEIYDFGATGEVWFCNYMGLCFACNGTKLIKYDGTNAYQVGIAAPSAGSAAKAAGGSLPEGTYQIYIGYARKVGGSNVLYGSGYSLGSVALSGSDLSVEITGFANSSDPQVNNKVVWMTDADGGTFYFYYETDDNTTETITITSDASRDSTRQYDVLAAYNHVPVNPQYIFVFDNRLWYLSNNQAFFSLQSGTIYDLEKFDTEADGNVLTFPYYLYGGFSVNGHLCFNSLYGIIVIPNGDISQRYEIFGAPYYFKYFRTVDVWNNLAIGLTNDGVRIFDGVSFTKVNISRDIKAAIQRCYTTSNDDFIPCAKVLHNKNSDRSEYVFSCIDNTVSGSINNRQWILDLDSMVLEGVDNYNTQWEKCQQGFQYITTKRGGTVYCLQSMPGKSNVVVFSQSATSDKWIYNEDGSWMSAETNRRLFIKTAEKIPDLLGYCRWTHLHVYGLAYSNVSFKVSIGDNFDRNYEKSFIIENDMALVDEAIVDVDIIGENTAIKNKIKLSRTLKGNSVYLEISQTADDPELIMNRVYLSGIIKRTRKS